MFLFVSWELSKDLESRWPATVVLLTKSQIMHFWIYNLTLDLKEQALSRYFAEQVEEMKNKT